MLERRALLWQREAGPGGGTGPELGLRGPAVAVAGQWRSAARPSAASTTRPRCCFTATVRAPFSVQTSAPPRAGPTSSFPDPFSSKSFSPPGGGGRLLPSPYQQDPDPRTRSSIPKAKTLLPPPQHTPALKVPVRAARGVGPGVGNSSCPSALWDPSLCLGIARGNAESRAERGTS